MSDACFRQSRTGEGGLLPVVAVTARNQLCVCVRAEFRTDNGESRAEKKRCVEPAPPPELKSEPELFSSEFSVAPDSHRNQWSLALVRRKPRDSESMIRAQSEHSFCFWFGSNRKFRSGVPWFRWTFASTRRKPHLILSSTLVEEPKPILPLQKAILFISFAGYFSFRSFHEAVVETKV